MSALSKESLVMKVIEKLARVRVGEIALLKTEQLATKMGVDEKRLLDLYVKTKNAAHRDRFASIPFSERILLLPQCLRSRDCSAKRNDYGYECISCGRCMLPRIIHATKRLGYKGVFIVSGGSVVQSLLRRVMPKGCLGVACLHELVLGSFLAEKMGVVTQGVQLAKDGCVDTVLDWSKLHSAIRLCSSK